MRAGSGNECAKKYTVGCELRDRENQVEDQHDDERRRLEWVTVHMKVTFVDSFRFGIDQITVIHIHWRILRNIALRAKGRFYAN